MRPLIARRETAAARDPAPSRLTYRAQRLWLTPLFRKMLRVSLPSFVIVLLMGSLVADPASRQAIVDSAYQIKREIEDRPEFRLTVLGITGASPQVTEDVRAALALELPLSSFDIDLEEVRARAEALPSVAEADLRIQAGGYLSVAITERVPAFVWNSRNGAVLIDAQGHFVAALEHRTLAAPLPIIAGDGADLAVDEAASLVATAASLGDRFRGLVRMGERRWDVVLTDERRILLPARDPVAALDRALALHDVTDLLNRDIVRIDLRNPARLTVQMSPTALEDYRRLRAQETETLSREQNG